MFRNNNKGLECNFCPRERCWGHLKLMAMRLPTLKRENLASIRCGYIRSLKTFRP